MDKEKTLPVKVSQDARKKRNAKLGVVYISGYTLHPPKEDIDPDDLKRMTPYITDSDLSEMENSGKTISGNEAYMLLHSREGQFEESKNPVYGIEAFLIAHEVGLYPPMWVLNYMAEIFNEFHKHQGSKSLDKLFELTRGKGQNNAFKNVLLYDRDETLMIDMDKLRMVYGCTIDEASLMVARRMEEIPENRFQNLKKLSDGAIKDKYMRSWKKIDEYKTELVKKPYLNWTDEQKAKDLSKYPEDSIPPRLKSLLQNDANKVLGKA